MTGAAAKLVTVARFDRRSVEALAAGGAVEVVGWFWLCVLALTAATPTSPVLETRRLHLKNAPAVTLAIDKLSHSLPMNPEPEAPTSKYGGSVTQPSQLFAGSRFSKPRQSPCSMW